MSEQDSLPGGADRHPAELALGAAAVILGIVAAVTGVIEWWLAAGIGGGCVAFAVATVRLGRGPYRPFELAALCILAGILTLAAKEVGDLAQDGQPTYEYRVMGGYVVPLYYFPTSRAESGQVVEQGQLVGVTCAIKDLSDRKDPGNKSRMWYRLNDPNKSYLPGDHLIRDFGSSGGSPPDC